MRRRILHSLLVAATLALGSVQFSSPGKADQFRHPIQLGEKCKALFENFVDWQQYYKAFAYTKGPKGYACATDIGTDAAIEKCDDFNRGQCKIYAKSPVDGKVAIVWKGQGSTAVGNAIQPPSQMVVESDWDICFEAVDITINWGKKSNFLGVWNSDTFPASWNNSDYVSEARRRNLTPEDCAMLLRKRRPNVVQTVRKVEFQKPIIEKSKDNKLIVRMFPSEDAQEIARLREDQDFVVDRHTEEGWSFIKFSSGRHGYVLSTDLIKSDKSHSTKTSGKTAAVHDKEVSTILEDLRHREQFNFAISALKTLGIYEGDLDKNDEPKGWLAIKRWLKANGRSENSQLTYEVVAQMQRQAGTLSVTNSPDLKYGNDRSASNKGIANKKSLQQKGYFRSVLRQTHRHAVAVIVGNRDYSGRTPDVTFAGNDADAFQNFVIDDLGYREGNVIDLRDATLSELNATFGTANNHKGRLFDYVREGKSDVIVFYSGHGVPGLKDRKGYLLPVNADPNRAELNGYPLDVLLTNLAKVPARSMAVYIDACFSGESQKGMLVQATSGITVQAKVPGSSKGMVVVTAAQNDQFASWDEDAKHGLFTKHLLEALRGKADGKGYGDGDGKVTLAELKMYLDEEMTYQARRRWSRDQNASVQGSDNAVLSTLQQ
jgi:hypothetical protein